MIAQDDHDQARETQQRERASPNSNSVSALRVLANHDSSRAIFDIGPRVAQLAG